MIHGLTYRLPEVGQIKIGYKGKEVRTKKGTEFRPPQKLDHFVIIKGYDENGEPIVDEQVMAELGEHPTELEVFLPYDSIELNFPTFLAWYTAARCQCKGDGLTAQYWNDETKQYEPRPCHEAGGCPMWDRGECKPHGILNVMLANTTTVGGVHVFRTTSWNSIRHILSCLANIAVHTGGVLHGIPLKMVLKPMIVHPKGTDTKQRVYVVHLEALATPTELVAMGKALKSESLTALEQQLLALPRADESEQEAKEVAEEYYPPSPEPPSTTEPAGENPDPDFVRFERDAKLTKSLKESKWAIEEWDGGYIVHRNGGEAHTVRLEVRDGATWVSCTCPDFTYRHRACVHCHAVKAYVEGLLPTPEVEK